MAQHTDKLSIKAPREYTFKDAYYRRVWRNPSVVIGREILTWSVLIFILGFLANHALIFTLSFMGMVISLFVMIVGSLVASAKKVSVIKRGLDAKAIIAAPRRLTFLHEFFKVERERTFILNYSFLDQNEVKRFASIWVCGCARQYFVQNSETPIAYDPKSPKNAIPLRLAVMVTPH